MKTILIGASGFVGSAIMKELLSRGHEVTALVRHPESIKMEDKHLKVIQADVVDKPRIIELCKGYDTVISAYNAGWSNPHIYQDTLKIYPMILDAVKKAGVKRILIVGGAGSLFVAKGKMLMDTGDLPESIMPGVKSLAAFYLHDLMKEKDIDWVFFSPAAILDHGNRTGKFRLGKDDLLTDATGVSRISVEDYAVAMVDEFEKPSHHHERFTIAY